MNYNCKNIIKRIDHFDLTSKDLVESAKFYQKLGFRYDNKKQNLYSNNFLIKLHAENSNAHPLPKNVSIGSIDICFESYLLPSQTLDYLKKRNIDIVLGPIEREGFNGKIYSVYVYDPSGNLLEFTSYCK